MAAKEAAAAAPVTKVHTVEDAKGTVREVPKDITPGSEPIKFNSGTVYVPAKGRK